jgi:hypothetical protein
MVNGEWSMEFSIFLAFYLLGNFPIRELFTIHHSPFTTHHSPFTIAHPINFFIQTI